MSILDVGNTTRSLHIRLAPALIEAVDRLAAADGRTRAGQIAILLAEQVQHRAVQRQYRELLGGTPIPKPRTLPRKCRYSR